MIGRGMLLSLALLCLETNAAAWTVPFHSHNTLERRGRTYQPSGTDDDALRLPIVRHERQFRKRQEPYSTPFGFIDTLPHLEVGIGNTDPPQATYVLLDTGSSELWVYSAALRDEYSYDPTLSTSDKCYLTPTFNITYGDGTDIDGYYCTEIVQVADLTVKNMTIGVPQTAIGEFAGDYGILGLAFKSGQRPVQKHSTLVDTMFEDGLIPARSYGIFLNQANSSNGEITFGGADLSRVVNKDLILLSMIKTTDPEEQRIFSSLSQINFVLGGEVFDENTAEIVSIPVLLDTGTPFSRFPPSLVESLAEEFGLTEIVDVPGFFEAPCSLKSETGGLRFTFTDDEGNGVDIDMPWSEAVVEVDDGLCLFVFASDEEDAPFYIMGQTFLQSTYLYVDLEEQIIGLGQAEWD